MLNTRPFYTVQPRIPSDVKSGEEMFQEQMKDPIKTKLYQSLKGKKFYRITPGLLMTEDVYQKSLSNPIISSHSIVDYAVRFVKHKRAYRDLLVSVDVDETNKRYRLIIKDMITKELIDDNHLAALGNLSVNSFDLFVRPLVANKEGGIVVVICTQSFIESLQRKVKDLVWKK